MLNRILAAICLFVSAVSAQDAATNGTAAPWTPPEPRPIPRFDDTAAAQRLQALEKALAEEDEVKRIDAVADLTSDGVHPSFVAPLTKALAKDKNATVREKCAEQLERLREPSATEVLVKAMNAKMNQKAPEVLGAIAMALGACADRPIYEDVRVHFLNGGAKVKKGLVLAFGRTKDEKSVDAISVWIDEPVGNLGQRVNGESSWWEARNNEWKAIIMPVRWTLWRVTGRGDHESTLAFQQWWKEAKKKRK